MKRQEFLDELTQRLTLALLIDHRPDDAALNGELNLMDVGRVQMTLQELLTEKAEEIRRG